MYVYVCSQGSDLGSVTADNFNVTVGGQICSELSVQETQVLVQLHVAPCERHKKLQVLCAYLNLI